MRDLYTEVAAERFNVDAKDVTPEQRAEVKRDFYVYMYSTSMQFRELFDRWTNDVA